MENEKNSNNKLIIAFIIVVVAIVGIGLVASNKITESKKKESEKQQEENNSETKEETENENKEILEVISKEEANELLSKYHADIYFQYHQDYSGFKEELKQYLAFINTKSIEVKNCADVYELTTTEYGDQIKIGEELTYCCADTTQVISYEDINETYKILFGSEKDMPKTNFQYLIYVYNYIEETDSFASSMICESGYAYPDIEVYNIEEIEVINNQLVISVNYIEFEISTEETDEIVYRASVGDQIIEIREDELVDEEFNIRTETTDNFFKTYEDLLPTYTYIFEKENDNLILVDFKS